MFWPYLWMNPLERFGDAFEWMSRFPWDDPVLFEGIYTASPDLPWWYLPEWQAISLPESYLFLYGAGWIIFLSFFVRNPIQFLRENHMLTWSAGICSAPLVAVWIFDSNVYDDWRHLYFTFPGMIVLMIFAIQNLIKLNSMIGNVVTLLLISHILYTGVLMIRWHPHQQVYFNEFAGKMPLEKYDGDYWGLSYKQGFEWILRNNEGINTFCPSNRAGLFAYMILTPEDTLRLKPASWNKAQWFLNNHRFEKQKFPATDIQFRVLSYGNEILSVSRMRISENNR